MSPYWSAYYRRVWNTDAWTRSTSRRSRVILRHRAPGTLAVLFYSETRGSSGTGCIRFDKTRPKKRNEKRTISRFTDVHPFVVSDFGTQLSISCFERWKRTVRVNNTTFDTYSGYLARYAVIVCSVRQTPTATNPRDNITAKIPRYELAFNEIFRLTKYS